MSTPYDGGSAFPTPAILSPVDGTTEWPRDPGMSVRDYFAGQALAGYLASFAAEGLGTPPPDKAAFVAYQFADAMVARREKGGGP